MKKLLAFLLFIPILLFSFNYETQWSDVEKLEKQRLPKSALEKIKGIYEEAKKEQNEIELIKALLHKEKLLFSQNKGDYAQNIYELEKELKSNLPENSKLILTSFLAELYAGYLDTYRYRIEQRTEVKENLVVSRICIT